MWNRGSVYFFLCALVVACSNPSTNGFSPFEADGDERTGFSECKWYPVKFDMPNIGKVSFNYKTCFKVNHNRFKIDGNWITYEYEHFYGDNERQAFNALGIFPLNGTSSETLLRETVFPEVLQNPLCEIVNRSEGFDPPSSAHPVRWTLHSAYNPEDIHENAAPVYPYDVCGPFAHNAYGLWQGAIGSHIAEKHGHLFVMLKENLVYEIDLHSLRFQPVAP